MSNSEAVEPGDSGGDVCMCRSSLASHGRTMRAYCGELERCQSLYKATASRIRPATAWMLHTYVWSRARSGLGEEVSLALGCVSSFHSEKLNRRFRSARGGSREGGRAFQGAHGKDTDRGGGRSSHLPPPRERPTGGGVRSTSGADHRPAGGSPRSRGGGYKVTLVLILAFTHAGAYMGSVHMSTYTSGREP